MYAHFPGLRVVVPSSPRDAKGLLKTALTCDDPVLFLEHRELMSVKGPVPEKKISSTSAKPLLCAKAAMSPSLLSRLWCTRQSRRVRHSSLKAPSVELIDPRTVAPLDVDTIIQSVAKTGRLIIVDDFAHCGIGAEIAAQLADRGFDELDAPIRRLNGKPSPTPYSPTLEAAVVPNVEAIAQAIRELCAE